MKKCIRIAVVLTAFASLPTLAMTQDSAGTEFWLAFEKNVDRSVNRLLLMTGDTVTSGLVVVEGLGLMMPFTVIPGTITSVELPTEVQVESSDQIEKLGIHVTSGREISVYGLNRIPFTTDAFLAFPVDILNREYIVSSYSSPGTQFAVVWTQDDTRVTSTPSTDAGSRAASAPYNVVLNRGQVYQLESLNFGADLTGTIITSNAPVSVFPATSA